MNHLLHSTDLFECCCWQNYTTVSNTDLYLSYFDLSYVFPGHNDSVEWGLTVIILKTLPPPSCCHSRRVMHWLNLLTPPMHSGPKWREKIFYIHWPPTKICDIINPYKLQNNNSMSDNRGWANGNKMNYLFLATFL